MEREAGMAATARKRNAPRPRRMPGPMAFLDHYLLHFDAVIRQRAVIPADREETFTWLERLDFAQLCQPVARAIEDMRAVPPGIAAVARRARRVPPGARFMVDDALRRGFVLLEEEPYSHLVLGAVGKLWKPSFELLPLDREGFLAFHQAKYVKLVVGFLVAPYGKDRALLRHETRFLATDGSARAHFARSWRVAEPFVGFFMQSALRTLGRVGREQRAAVARPPWRAPRRLP